MVCDRLIDPLRDVAIGRFERTRARRRLVEFARQPRAIGIERMDLAGKRFLGAVGVAPALGRSVERVERLGQPPGRDFDRIGVAHAAIRAAIRGPHTKPKIVRLATVYRKNFTSYRGKASTARVGGLCMTRAGGRTRN